MSQPVSHFSLPGVVAKVEGAFVTVEEDGESIAKIALTDIDAFVALLKAAAKSASNEAVKVIGKPRAKKTDTMAS